MWLPPRAQISPSGTRALYSEMHRASELERTQVRVSQAMGGGPTPYGAWPSPITSQLITQGSLRLGSPVGAATRARSSARTPAATLAGLLSAPSDITGGGGGLTAELIVGSA
jgi:hypothetical protein